MKEHLSGIEARDRGIVELCQNIAGEGYRVVIPHGPVALEDLDAQVTPTGPVDGDGTPLWIYGSALPRRLVRRASKVQVHEPFDDREVPDWFDHRFPQYIRETTVPGWSCFSPGSLTRATENLLEEFPRVRLKDPNGASGVGQYGVGSPHEIAGALDEAAGDVRASHGQDLADYLAEFGYVVEADVDDVEAWSVTLTRTPGGHYSSFGRLFELTVETADRGTVQNYAGTSIVVVRGDPEDLRCLPEEGVEVSDPVETDRELRLRPSPGIVHAAQRYIEGMRLWEGDGAIETRANVDVITGTLVRRDGTRTEVAAAVEDSGRVGGASPAELLGITALRDDSDLTWAVRCSRHSFDDTARAYARYAESHPGSHVFWDGVDDGWDGKYVFIGAF